MFFTQDGKNRTYQRLFNLKGEKKCFLIVFSRQFPLKYRYVLGLCIDTVLLAFISSFIDVSMNRRSPNLKNDIALQMYLIDVHLNGRKQVFRI